MQQNSFFFFFFFLNGKLLALPLCSREYKYFTDLKSLRGMCISGSLGRWKYSDYRSQVVEEKKYFLYKLLDKDDIAGWIVSNKMENEGLTEGFWRSQTEHTGKK